ncbi:MAG: hypothetical protein K9H16_10170, partial [Bacteroidales bacterium]|nr:hypothetical protein [Bacteroidales bacterium]
MKFFTLVLTIQICLFGLFSQSTKAHEVEPSTGFFPENSIHGQSPSEMPTFLVNEDDATVSPSQASPLQEVICPNNIFVCCNEPAFTLTGATPAGGTYFLNNTPVTEFVPDCGNTGTFEIKYIYSNPFTGFTDSCFFNIKVFPFAELICPEDIIVCCDEPTFNVTGAAPTGGIYYLNDAPITTFTPDCENTGDFEIKFVFTNPFWGCSDSCFFNITVLPLPEVTCPDDIVVCCNEEPFPLSGAIPDGGIYLLNGNAISEFAPDCDNVGVFNITYLYADPATGCENTCDFTITVNALPELTCPDDLSVCCDAEPFVLTGASPEGGIYYLDGVAITTFTPECDNLGDFEISYIYTDPLNGCQNSCNFTISVIALPEVSCPENIVVCCEDDPFELSGATPPGGVYYLNGNPATTFTPDCDNIGDFQITYTYVDAETSCQASCGFTISVVPMPEVTCPDDFVVCCDAEPVLLTGGLPEGGVYTGEGVTIVDNEYFFTPDCGITGSNEIIYTYTDMNNCSGTCSFSIEVFPAAQINIIPDDTLLCGMTPMNFAGLVEASDYGTVIWLNINGTGSFDNDQILEPVYYPSQIDIMLGCINLSVSVSSMDPCTNSYSDNIQICFQAPPDVNAGSDASVCEDENYFLEDASAGNYTGLLWASSGNGTFDNETLINPTYFPDVTDYNTVVELCLTAQPVDPCELAVTDCMELSVFEFPEPVCPENFSVCCDSEPVLLNFAEPQGGEYSGTGVTFLNGEFYFTPDCASTGDFQISYTYTVGGDCSGTCSFMITVNPIPEVVCPESFDVCCNAEPQLLENANPEGGIYAGVGVILVGNDYFFA